MIHLRRPIVVLPPRFLTALLASLTAATWAAETGGGAAAAGVEGWLPSSTMAVFHSAQPDPLLELLLDPGVLRQVPLEKKPAEGLQGIGRFLETELGCDWKTVLRKSMRQGFTLAVAGKGAVILVVRSGDPVFLQKLNEAFVKAGWWGNPAAVSQSTHAGTVCWTISGGKEHHALLGETLILANQLPLLKQALDLQAGRTPASESLAAVASYEAARRGVRKDAVGALLVAPALVNALPAFQRKPDASPHPLGLLLLGRDPGGAAPAAGKEWVSLDFALQGRTLLAGLAGDRFSGGQAAAFASPPAGDGLFPLPAVPRQIASLSLWRDLQAYYAAKDTLFPERTSALIFFENLMGIYFSGRDLTEDVMGALDPHVRLVVAEQAYDPAVGTPTVQVPAFAAIFRMRQPQKFAPIAEEAWQKALGLINFTRGQKAESGMILDKREHGGVRYSCAAFSAAEEADKTKLDVRFNFRPAIAFAGEFLILSSTEQLTDDLIDALSRPVQAVAGSNGLMEVDGPRLASVLLANRENLVRDTMLKKGKNRAAAESDLKGLTLVARMLGLATLRTGNQASQPFLDLKLEFDGGSRAHP